MCNGSGYKYGKTGLGHGAPGCDWCDGLGAVFSEIVFRGHPKVEGRCDVIEGSPPVHIAFNIEGETLLFERAHQTEPPHWFIKEDGKQVFQFTRKR
jgi:hypothetical protein